MTSRYAQLHINPCKFNRLMTRVRDFFNKKGFVEVHTQNRLSILAACEDPTNIEVFNYAGQVWPLPQTGQMWLEYEMLKNPTIPGLYCLSTSYRNEPEPVEGRHDKIFPMIEFEIHGGVDDLISFEKDFLGHLGFKNLDFEVDYNDVAKKYKVKELDHDHEARLCKEHGSVVFLKNFPEHTSPFWNMARDPKGWAKKVDVIIEGIETIGSAERSCDPDEMRMHFETISDGAYAKTLYGRFTKERVQDELKEFLDSDFVARSGGGIGVTRLLRAMEINDLL